MRREQFTRNLVTAFSVVLLSAVLYGCGGGGGSAGTDPGPDPALGVAQKAAMAAADAAEAAVSAQTANKDADEGSYAVASDAAKRARAAATAAEATTDTAMAQGYQATAETERDKAVKYAGMVADAQKALDDEEQRKMDVATARSAAMGSAGEAAADATKAETQAAEAETTAPGTAGAMAARAAATAARAAATAAQGAHDAITDGMTKAAADAKAADAASQAAEAKKQYMMAKAENDTIQTAKGINDEQQRKNAIADARMYGGAAVAKAKKAADDAQAAADDAQAAATAANNAYMAAMSARTDATEAKKQADMAQAAATAAQTAATAANDAYMAAQAAIDGVTDDSTKTEADAARMAADTKADEAATSKATAMTQQTAAEGAQAKAAAARGEHTLGLLMAANLVDEENAKTRAAEVKKVAASIGDAAGSSTDGDNNSTTESGGGTVGVTATWNANTAANPDADPPTAEVPMYASVTITGVQGNNIVSVIDKQQVDNSDPKDGDFDDDGDVKANAKMITGLTGFSHGFDITDGQRTAIVFTDIEQQVAAAAAVTLGKAVNISNKAAVASSIVLPDNATDLSNAAYDHDGDSSTNALTGVTFTCTSSVAANCSYTIEDGKLTAIKGYVFSVSAADTFVLKAAKEAVADATYLAFGVWMDEDGDGDNTNALAPELGAFAGGGDVVNGDIQAVTGTATYSGKAAGVYTQGSSVDYFHGNATLTADFGKKPDSGADTVNGTVKGMIDNIMAGGMATGDVIKLSGAETNGAIADAATISDTATFAGIAHMGSGTTKNNITTYMYNGSWDGSFYNPVDIPAGEDNAGQNDLTKAPGSAAGTFGVTGTMGEGDAAVTTSYVGAFGAHK